MYASVVTGPTPGMAFSNASVALVHGMRRPIGAFFHVPHGLPNAMLLPEITAFSVPAALERYADCARAMGVAEETEGNQARGRAPARRAAPAERLSPGPHAARLGHRAACYEARLPVMASRALVSGSPAKKSAHPDERRNHRSLSPRLRVTAGGYGRLTRRDALA